MSPREPDSDRSGSSGAATQLALTMEDSPRPILNAMAKILPKPKTVTPSHDRGPGQWTPADQKTSARPPLSQRSIT